MDLQLQDRVALVVGGTGYIGRAIVETLRAEGATVVSAARGEGADLVLDAASDESVAAGVAAVLERHGRLDALVVTAAPAAQTLDASRSSEPDEVAQAIAGKALTFLRVANAAIPAMRDANYGRIVGVSGQNAVITGSIAAGSRNAVLALAAKHLADELAGTGVHVDVVNPGPVVDDPAGHASARPDRGAPGPSSPKQIADLVAFLASPRSAVTGESIATGHRVRGVV
jgi:NAD(P)-dependent dehydrogenase (short-subunit alcohol dehydrogenase family)